MTGHLDLIYQLKTALRVSGLREGDRKEGTKKTVKGGGVCETETQMHFDGFNAYITETLNHCQR